MLSLLVLGVWLSGLGGALSICLEPEESVVFINVKFDVHRNGSRTIVVMSADPSVL